MVGEEEGAVGREWMKNCLNPWINRKEGLRVFAVYSLDFEGWTPRNEAFLEAVIRRTRRDRYPWLIACDANMEPETFQLRCRFRKETVFVAAPKNTQTCAELIGRVHDDVIDKKLKERIKEVKAVEDLESHMIGQRLGLFAHWMTDDKLMKLARRRRRLRSSSRKVET